MDLREQIKMLRRNAGLTQGELAAHAGWSLSFYAKFEKGTKNINPTLDKLEALAEVLNTKFSMVS